MADTTTIAEKIAQAESERQRIAANIADAYTEAKAKGATMPVTENSANLADTVASIPEAVQPTLITKQITANGTYSAEDDNADGYDEVTVDVPVPTPVEEKYINFIDYDGTVLYSWSEEELQEATELPPLPTREGYTYQEWNWDLADLKQYNVPVYVGAIMKPSNGASQFIFEFVDGDPLSPVLYFLSDVGTITVDWGDGTEPDVLESTGRLQGLTFSHTYNRAGKYQVSVLYEGTSIFRTNTWMTNGFLPPFYYTRLTAVFLGDNIDNFVGNSTTNLTAVKTISLPRNIINIYKGFNGARVCSFILPKSYGCSFIAAGFCVEKKVSIPVLANDTVTDNMFIDCSNLVSSPKIQGITAFGNGMYYGCSKLSSFKVKNTIQSIGSQCFQRCTYLYVLDLSEYIDPTSIPTLVNTNALTNTPSNQIIYVANQEMLDAFSTATNWSTYADRFQIKGATP